jgi:hypothetical protein
LPELAITWSTGRGVRGDSLGEVLCGRTRCMINVAVPIIDYRQMLRYTQVIAWLKRIEDENSHRGGAFMWRDH